MVEWHGQQANKWLGRKRGIHRQQKNMIYEDFSPLMRSDDDTDEMDR